MYLLDTNIWLERLLGQPQANEVEQLLGLIPSDELSSPTSPSTRFASS
jgi:predicted nucleic acid-binding protein